MLIVSFPQLVAAVICLQKFIVSMSEAASFVVRETNYGKVNGTFNLILQTETFLGVPYAEPPVKGLRWRPPVQHSGWNRSGEVWDATYARPFCPQILFGTYVGEEDCLFLNIYAPVKTDSYLPVMVIVHGGGWYFGGPSFYDGSLLASMEKVIVVTFAYRLGALGFMSTDDSQSPGNYGQLDQIAVLQWVRENIRHFGGDTTRVTAVGLSAGASSALLLALSPMSRLSTSDQLLHRVIAASGSPLGMWTFQSNPRYFALELMKELKCPDFSTSLGIRCLRGKGPEEIVAGQGSETDWEQLGIFPPWTPSNDGQFLTGLPDSVVSQPHTLEEIRNRYDFMVGVNDFDVIAFEYGKIRTVENEEDFLDIIQGELKWYFQDYEKMAKVASLNYIDYKTPPKTPLDWQRLVVNISRDMGLLSPAVNISRVASSIQGFNSSVYFYYFVQRPGQALIDAGLTYPSDELLDGALHGDEFWYVLGLPLILPNASLEDQQLSIQMMRYWANFVKTGDPSQGSPVENEWPTFDWNKQKYLQLGSKNGGNITRVSEYLETQRVVFWTEELPLFEEGKGLVDSIFLSPANDTATPPNQEIPVVVISQGAVKGIREIQDNEIVMDKFIRVPYAQPPLALLRFKPPQQHTGWDGVLNVHDAGSSSELHSRCLFYDSILDVTYGNEDCLYLDIYVPDGINGSRPSDQLLPVMVWFNNGGVMFGGKSECGSCGLERLCTQGYVVGVSVNYRLGALGFLSTMDTHAPANIGLLDQVLALQWIQENIVHFGGDPSRVTLFGQSAGSAPVVFHTISPLSKSLFHRSISQSGTAFAAWSLSRDPLRSARLLADYVGCPSSNNKIMLRCLQNKPAEVIIKAGYTVDMEDPMGNTWSAVIDGYFLEGDPLKMLNASEDKDLLIGHNSMDGHLFASRLFSDLDIDEATMSRDDVRKAAHVLPGNMSDQIADIITYKYINWSEQESGMVWPKIAIVDMFTDNMFVAPAYRIANERAAAASKSRTFFYRFNERTESETLPSWMQSEHMSELKYVFGVPFEDGNFTDVHRRLSTAMMTYWTNFAWTGDPNYPNEGDIYSSWPEYDLQDKFALEFNTSVIVEPHKFSTLLSNYRGDFVQFWNGLLQELGGLSFDQCPGDGNQTSVVREEIEHTVYGDELVSIPTCSNATLIRATESGCIKGHQHEINGLQIERYLGIPYAAPPTGSRRFRLPEAAHAWSDVLIAESFGSDCMQQNNSAFEMSEDCLYLNIYVPRVDDTYRNNGTGLAVMIWIHGGHFMDMSGRTFNGDTLASLGKMIVVTMNYRLGSFGFMTTDDGNSTGNYGLFDQRFAIMWVKRNIANFGGDPGLITLSGNSAGGLSVYMQAISQLNADIAISRAIIQSADMIIEHGNLKQSDSTIRLAEKASCPVNLGNDNIVSCLRGLNASDLLQAQIESGQMFGPTEDGYFFPEHPRIAASHNETANWTFLMGCNSGDGSVQWEDIRIVQNRANFQSSIQIQFEDVYGWRHSLIESEYANDDDVSFFENSTKMHLRLIEMYGDEKYIIPSLERVHNHDMTGGNTYMYYFTYPDDITRLDGFPADGGAPHAWEVSFIDGEILNSPLHSVDAKNLSRGMIQYWSNFVKTGDPNRGYYGDPDVAVDWLPFSDQTRGSMSEGGYYLKIDTGRLLKMQQNLKPQKKAFWLDLMAQQSEYCEVDQVEGTTVASPSPTYNDESPVVTTSSGPILGKRIESDLFDVNVFLGVPYAKAPLGELRFAKTQQIADWADILNTTAAKSQCLQWNDRYDTVIGNEDCLYLDIYVPTGLLKRNGVSMPVMFLIHGDSDGRSSRFYGNFWFDGYSQYESGKDTSVDPRFIANLGNVVVVKPNFRLGALGFLTSESDEMSGNYGLYDLKEALRWTFANAHNFGGDAEKLTILGHGSGAAAAEMLAILPSTKDYVKRVISMSGSALAPWAFCHNGCSDVFHQTIRATPCSNSRQGVLECLRAMDASTLIAATPFRPINKGMRNSTNAWSSWRFYHDGDLIPRNALIQELYNSSNFDFITGTTSHEFYIYLNEAYSVEDTRKSSTLITDVIADTAQFLHQGAVELWSTGVLNLLSHDYTDWGNSENAESAFLSVVNYYTDLMYAVHSSESIKLIAGSSSNACYRYVISRNILDSNSSGAKHGDDVVYSFGLPFTNPDLFNNADREVSLSIMSYWINFAWTGDPNNAMAKTLWNRYWQSNKYFLNIDDSQTTLESTDFNEEKNALWESVLPDFYLESVPTPDPTSSFTTDLVDNEDPVIGEGLGLSLSAASASTAIYILFSFCLVLGVAMLGLLILLYLSRRSKDS